MVLVIGLCSIGQSWANVAPLDKVAVLPLTRDRMLVKIQKSPPSIIEVTRYKGFPALFLKDASIPQSWLNPEQHLNPPMFLRPVNYPVKAVHTQTGVFLVFQSHAPLVLSVTTSDSAFLAEAARELPLYPTWPEKSLDIEVAPHHLVDEAYAAFEQNRLNEATQALETLLYALPSPPKALYQLLGVLYLYRDNWLKALLIYGEGAHQYPEVLAIRYSALLYQLNQKNKAIQALEDLLITVDIPPDTQAQAHYMLGSIYTERQAYDKALPHLEQAAVVFSATPEVLFNLAIAYEGTQHPRQALEAYEKALPLSTGALNQEVLNQIQRLKKHPALKYNRNSTHITPLQG